LHQHTENFHSMLPFSPLAGSSCFLHGGWGALRVPALLHVYFVTV
jgi:hypothetical protein